MKSDSPILVTGAAGAVGVMQGDHATEFAPSTEEVLR